MLGDIPTFMSLGKQMKESFANILTLIRWRDVLELQSPMFLPSLPPALES